MALIEEFEKQGNWLFKRRSFLPLVLALFGILVLWFSTPWFDELYDSLFGIFCIVVSFSGLVVRIITVGRTPKGTSGRNREAQVAEQLNTTGIYSVVRHPLYLGNFFTWLGIALFIQNAWFLLAFCLIYWIYYERIMFAEESFLRKKFGESYVKWSEHTPAFLPCFKNRKHSNLTFSWKNVLKREYNGMFSIVVTFTVLEIIRNYFHYQKFVLNIGWSIFFVVGLLIFLVLRTIKKTTHLLEVEGR